MILDYNQAISAIKINPYAISHVDSKLIDLKMLRFTRRYHRGSGAWAVQAYSPKAFANSIHVWVDTTENFEDISLT
jgi:hypothetical protein